MVKVQRALLKDQIGASVKYTRLFEEDREGNQGKGNSNMNTLHTRACICSSKLINLSRYGIAIPWCKIEWERLQVHTIV